MNRSVCNCRLACDYRYSIFIREMNVKAKGYFVRHHFLSVDSAGIMPVRTSLLLNLREVRGNDFYFKFDRVCVVKDNIQFVFAEIENLFTRKKLLNKRKRKVT